MSREFRPLAERFWSKVEKTDDCWIWTGSRLPSGYGQLGSGGRRGRPLGAHRVSWEIHRGPIPRGLHVLHHCDNPPCVNPAHLWLGTDADNAADKVKKGRQLRGDAHRAVVSPSLPRGSAIVNHVLTESLVSSLRKRYRAGERIADLARELPVCKQVAWKAITGETWRHVT